MMQITNYKILMVVSLEIAIVHQKCLYFVLHKILSSLTSLLLSFLVVSRLSLRCTGMGLLHHIMKWMLKETLITTLVVKVMLNITLLPAPL